MAFVLPETAETFVDILFWSPSLSWAPWQPFCGAPKVQHLHNQDEVVCFEGSRPILIRL